MACTLKKLSILFGRIVLQKKVSNHLSDIGLNINVYLKINQRVTSTF